MAFERVCNFDDLWEGEMDMFEVAGHEVLVIHGDGGYIRAVQGICPHQEIPLAEGTLEGKVLTCRAHLWQFDVEVGASVNPEGCKLAIYPVEVRDEEIYVDVTGIEPFFSVA